MNSASTMQGERVQELPEPPLPDAPLSEPPGIPQPFTPATIPIIPVQAAQSIKKKQQDSPRSTTQTQRPAPSAAPVQNLNNAAQNVETTDGRSGAVLPGSPLPE
jgi:hypothetical protein